MQPDELLKHLVEQVHNLAKVETVVGEPINVAGYTVIPISKVMVGFGGGSGSGESGAEAKKQQGIGGGGGGGVRLEPAAFIVAKEGELSILAAPGKRGALADLFEHMPDLIDKLVEAKRDKQGGGEG